MEGAKSMDRGTITIRKNLKNRRLSLGKSFNCDLFRSKYYFTNFFSPEHKYDLESFHAFHFSRSCGRNFWGDKIFSLYLANSTYLCLI